MRCTFLFLICLFAVPFTTLQAFGQNLERDQLSATGTIKGAAPGVIQIATDKGDMWRLKVEAKPQDVTFAGTAEKSFLRAGMFVEFRAQVSKKGVVVEPVAKLSVFTPSDGRPPGVDPDGNVGGGALFSESQGEKKTDPKAKRAAKLKGDDTLYRVAGAISKVGRAGDLTVSIGGMQIKFNLAEDCKISVDTNDLAFVSPGDKVVVQGWFFKGRPGDGAVSKIEVTAANPLTDGKKKLAKPEKGAKSVKGEKPIGEKEDAAKKDGDKKETEKPAPKKDE
jgi:hypothetical protein